MLYIDWADTFKIKIKSLDRLGSLTGLKKYKNTYYDIFVIKWMGG